MSEEKEIDSVIKQDAKTIVDMMFDNDLFKDYVNRDHMNLFENLVGYLMQSRFDSYKRGMEFQASINDWKKNNQELANKLETE